MRYIIITLLFASCNSASVEEKPNGLYHNQGLNYFGFMRLDDSLTNNFQKGNYFDGFKSGNWTYSVNQTNYIKDWIIYEEVQNLKINIPSDWEILNDEIVQFTAKGETFLNDTSQIVIYRVSIDTLKYKLVDYKNKFNQDLYKQWEVLEVSEQCFLNNNQKVEITKYHLKKELKDYFCFSMIMIIDGEVLDISYYFKTIQWERHYNMFFDFINGLKINDKFLTNHEFDKFNPLGFYLCN